MKAILENAKRFYRLKQNQRLPEYQRFLFESLKNSKAKITGLYGSRGVGKTTLLLQILKELDYQDDEKL